MKNLYLWVALATLPFIALGQDTVRVQRWDVMRGLDGVGYTISSPVRWKGKDWITVGGVALTTAAITLLDHPVRSFFQQQDSELLDDFEWVGDQYGQSYVAVSITSGVYLAGLILKDEWAQETGLMLGTGLTSSFLVQRFFKNALGRARPGKELGHYNTDPFSSDAGFHSLPSGHTTFAFTVSLIMARQVRSVPVKILFYSLATCTAASRLYVDAHWVSDLAFGGAIAWFCADAAIKRIQSNKFRYSSRRSDVTVKLYPYPGGLSLCARF